MDPSTTVPLAQHIACCPQLACGAQARRLHTRSMDLSKYPCAQHVTQGECDYGNSIEAREMGHGSEQRTSHAPVDRTCMNCSMSPFASGLLEQASVADGELRSQLQQGYGLYAGVLHGASSARPDALGFSEGASWAAPTAISYEGPGGWCRKNVRAPRGGSPMCNP